MKTRGESDNLLPALAICVLLLLSSWPVAMLLASGLGIIAWLYLYRGERRQRMLLVAGIASGVGAAIALGLTLFRGL